ncbi:MAG: hypothetical protein QM788_01775 [Roseateles sp.]|uniref:hypothetical protein n=1 Tax=Roseateles sp. TaxID=1971397 RepID=UPI0039E72D33
MSATQVNKLGERLRGEPITPDDLLLLDDYRRQFAAASAEVERVLREEFHQQPATREAKSTPAICAKLRRERGSRLASMQDIAGCRVVVADRQAQRSLARALALRFAGHRHGEGDAALLQWMEALSEAVDRVERGLDGEAVPPPAEVPMLPAGPGITPDRDNLARLLKALVTAMPVLGE